MADLHRAHQGQQSMSAGGHAEEALCLAIEQVAIPLVKALEQGVGQFVEGTVAGIQRCCAALE